MLDDSIQENMVQSKVNDGFLMVVPSPRGGPIFYGGHSWSSRGGFNARSVAALAT